LLRDVGADKVFAEKVSGAKTDRRQLQRAMEALGAGDVLLVTRLDRLARSTRDLLNVLAAISEKGAGFRSIADVWADTTTAHGRLGGLSEVIKSGRRLRGERQARHW
jgi:DNA invertase Pin-like site-specific DNA recombinase